MNYLAPLLVASLVACGPKDTANPATAPHAEPAVAASPAPPAAPTTPATPAAAVKPLAKTTANVPVPAPLAPAKVSVLSPALGMWLAKQQTGAKAAPQTTLPQPVRVALLSLANKLVPSGRTPTIRWALPLGTRAIAFSYNVPPGSYGDPTYQFSVAVQYDKNARFGAHSVAEGYPKPEGTNDWSRGKRRDVDGDGVLDEIIHYDTGMSGGGDNLSGGSILLGSRGGALDVSLSSTDSSYDTEGECDNTSQRPSVLCWTTMDKRPLLLAVVAATDHCAKTKRPKFSYAAVRAMTDGRLVIDDVFVTVTARGTRAAMNKERAQRGARTVMPIPKEGDYEAPACGAGPLVVPDGASFALVSGLSSTRPKGDSLLFHLPGHGAGLANVGRLGIKAPYTPKTPRTDKRGVGIAPGSKHVEFVADDGAIIGGTLWSTNDKNQVTIIMVNGQGHDRYGWLPIVRQLASRNRGKPPRARVLSIDMRGHGGSTRSVAGGVLDTSDFSDKDWQAAVADVKAAIRYARGLEPTGPIALAGATFGATLAVHAAVDENIKRVALLSPRANEKGLEFATAYKKLVRLSRSGGHAPLLVYSADDAEANRLHRSLGGRSFQVQRKTKGTNLLSDSRARLAIQKALID